MPVLTAVFKAADEMSSVFDRMADSGSRAVEQWERSGDVAEEAFGTAKATATEAAQAMDDAAASTDYWTEALGNYDRGAMEAIYTTEELVDLGFKTEEALEAEAQAAEEAAREMEQLANETEEAGDESGKFGKVSKDAINQLEQAIVSAGLVMLVKEIGTAFMESADAAMIFETAVAKVATLADTSVVSMKDITSAIKGVSNEMGVSANEISEATYQAISGSVDTADAVQFVAEATMLAKGGFTQSTTAVDVLTTAVNAYGLTIEEVEQVSSMLITTQNLGKTSVDLLAKSLGQVIPVAAAYDVEMDNLSTAYAVLTKGGIETANATTYMRGMLQELGSTSSGVSKILMEETGKSFSELMSEGYSLGDVMDILGQTVDGNTTAFANLWQSQTAGLGALSLFNAGSEEFNATLLQMQDSSGAVANAYEIMADTTMTSKDKMETAQENMAASFGNVLLPVLDSIYNAGAKAFTWIGNVIEEHPAVAAVVTALAVGLGVVVLGIVGYSAAMAIASAATAAFGAIAGTALWPITLIVAGVAALVAGIALLVGIFGNANEEFNSLTAASKRQYEQLEELNTEYDRAVEVYGENSYEAQQLRWEIEALEEEYESCKMTMEEFVAQNDALIESHEKLMDSYSSTMSELDKEEKGTAALIDKLEELGSKTELTAAEQQQMSIIIDKLNEQIPDLAMSYDDFTGSVDKSVAAIKSLAQAQAQEQRQAAQAQAYVDLLADRTELAEQLEKATTQAAAAQERFDSASGWDQFWNVGKVKSDLEDLTAEEERLQAALDETDAILAEHEQAFEEAARAAEEAANATVSYEEGVSRSVSIVSEEMAELIGKYDEAYEAARSSIDSTIGLFDTMATECELSIKDMMGAMQSQVDYLATYTENLRLAAEYGLDEGLIASLSDGSEESAGYINAIIEEVERLGGSTEGLSEDAAAFVEQFNGAFQEVETAKDDWADTVATMETDFDNAMADIEGRMTEAIDNMNMESDAAAAAKDTIQAYINQIKSMTHEAHSAAEGVANATASALGGKGVSVNIPGYATGTRSAERGVKLVGEEGPELVSFDGGEIVYDADESRRILDGANAPIQTSVPNNMEASRDADGRDLYSTEKKIKLEIEGSGEIDVSGQYDEERIWGIVSPQLKQAIMGLLKQEMYEEGQRAYEF